MKNYLDDIFFWLGAALISAGAYFMYPPAALVAAGGFCLGFSYLIGKARSNA